eukprot:364282-Chlamydomonas_euryale.AAC.21
MFGNVHPSVASTAGTLVAVAGGAANGAPMAAGAADGMGSPAVIGIGCSGTMPDLVLAGIVDGMPPTPPITAPGSTAVSLAAGGTAVAGMGALVMFNIEALVALVTFIAGITPLAAVSADVTEQPSENATFGAQQISSDAYTPQPRLHCATSATCSHFCSGQ